MKNLKLLLAGLLSGFCCIALRAETNAIPWHVPVYTLTARALDLREALDTFAIAEGVPLVMSGNVKGSFSGNFADMPASEFLDRVATMHNLTWYYDGATLYVYGAGETLSTLIDLKYMKAPEVQALLCELGVEDARFPIKAASNGEILMVSGPPRYVELVSELIARADKLREIRTFNEVDVRVFPLVHTWADSVTFSASSPESSASIKGMAELLAELMDETTRSSEATTNEVADAAQDKANQNFKPVIIPENRLNAVIVRDVTTRMPMYERLIKQFDVPQKLVEIGVTVLEMSKENSLDWQASLRVTGAHKDTSATGGMNAENLFGQDDVGGKGLAGAFSYLGSKVNVEASLTALRAKGKTMSISRTSILTVNNMAAEMSDTQTYHVKVVGTEVADLQDVSAGTKLSVKPRILEPPAGMDNEPTRIWLSMELDDGGFEGVNVDSMPMSRTTTLTTQASLPENDSLLLAGYFRDVKSKAGWGIPILRDIPLIGWLFGGSSTQVSKVQRLFIVTPHIIDVDYYHSTTQLVSEAQMNFGRDTTLAKHLFDGMDDDDRAQEVVDAEREAKERKAEEEAQAEIQALKEEAKTSVKTEAVKPAEAVEKAAAPAKTEESKANSANVVPGSASFDSRMQKQAATVAGGPGERK